MDHQPRSDHVAAAEGGQHPSVTAKTRISTIPVTNVGVEIPTSDKALHEPRRRAVGLQRTQHAERDAERQRQDRRDEHQFHGRWKPLGDQRRHGTLIAVADSEIAGGDAPEKLAVLNEDRLIEAEGAAQFLLLLESHPRAT